MAKEIVVYGSDWCGYTQRTLRKLKGLNVDFRYVDVDAEPEAEKLIASWNNGRSIRPTLDLDGDILVNPSDDKLVEELKTHGHLTA